MSTELRTGQWPTRVRRQEKLRSKNDTAVFYPFDDHKCKIVIRFLAGNKLKVSEENTMDCGFGMNVTSEGTYTKIKAGKPKFDSDR